MTEVEFSNKIGLLSKRIEAISYESLEKDIVNLEKDKNALIHDIEDAPYWTHEEKSKLLKKITEKIDKSLAQKKFDVLSNKIKSLSQEIRNIIADDDILEANVANIASLIEKKNILAQKIKMAFESNKEKSEELLKCKTEQIDNLLETKIVSLLSNQAKSLFSQNFGTLDDNLEQDIANLAKQIVNQKHEKKVLFQKITTLIQNSMDILKSAQEFSLLSERVKGINRILVEIVNILPKKEESNKKDSLFLELFESQIKWCELSFVIAVILGITCYLFINETGFETIITWFILGLFIVFIVGCCCKLYNRAFVSKEDAQKAFISNIFKSVLPNKRESEKRRYIVSLLIAIALFLGIVHYPIIFFYPLNDFYCQPCEEKTENQSDKQTCKEKTENQSNKQVEKKECGITTTMNIMVTTIWFVVVVLLIFSILILTWKLFSVLSKISEDTKSPERYAIEEIMKIIKLVDEDYRD